jgi:hypothetical protein
MKSIYQEKVGRFNVLIDNDEFAQNPNEMEDGLLFANQRDFHVMSEGKFKYKHLIDAVLDNQTSKFYFVTWNSYSSASNPVLRDMTQGYTIDDLKKSFLEKSKNSGWFDGMDDETIMEEFENQCDIETEYGDCMIVADSDEQAKSTLATWKEYFDGCYMYTIKNEEGKVIDSCSGYYGDYEKYCLEEARSAAKTLEEEAVKEDAKIEEETRSESVTMDTPLRTMLTSSNEQIKRLAKGIYKEITR